MSSLAKNTQRETPKALDETAPQVEGESAEPHEGTDHDEIKEVEIYNGEDGDIASDKHTGLRPGYEVVTKRSRKKEQTGPMGVISTTTTMIGNCEYNGCKFQRHTIETESEPNGGRVFFLSEPSCKKIKNERYS